MTANFASGTVWTGDNLPVMRGMNSACVGLIYLDPPFNSNRTYEAPIGSKAAGAAVMALMRAAPNWGAFQRSLKRAFPKLRDQREMDLGDDG